MKFRQVSLTLGLFLAAAFAMAQEEVPKAEVYGGYSYIRVNPGTQVNAFNSNGGLGAFQLNINKHIGVVADLGGNHNGHINVRGPGFPTDQTQFNYLFGPRFSVNKTGKLTPFFEYLVGASHNSRSFSLANSLIPAGVTVPRGVTVEPGSPGFTKFRSTQNAVAMAVGGGLDYKLSKLIAIRPIELDYFPTHFSPFNFTPLATSPLNAFPNFNHARWQQNLRYSGGVDFRFGGAPPPEPHASCTGSPAELLPDDPPVTATVQPSNFNPKHTLDYKWTSTGGQVAGEGNSAKVDVANLSPGSYTVKATVTDPKRKTRNTAYCTTAFTVKQPQPPQVSCTASPNTIEAGSNTPVTISAQGSSPDGRKLQKRDFSATAGSVQGGQTTAGQEPGQWASTATLNTQGVQPGPVNVTITVTDVRGLTGSCLARVDVTPPPVTVASETLLTECQFNDSKKPARVGNVCKASLDDIAVRLQATPEGKLVVVGNAEQEETVTIAAQRAVNSKYYLTSGEGRQQIDPSRIETRTAGGGKKAQFYLVPPGGNFTVQNTSTVDEGQVKPSTH